MTTPEPEPATTPGLEPGGGVDPGDTPPDAGQTSGAVGTEGMANVGPVSGNRTPMIIALVALGIVVLMVAAFTVASLIPS